MFTTLKGRVIQRALILVGALLLSACGLLPGNNHPPAPTNASTQDYSYIIGPGDNLNIIVWRNPELSMSVPVRPDGKFSTPLIDELVAQGKNSVEIARDIEKLLGKYVRDPVVTVIITGFVGPYDQQIRVVGEAAKPQVLAYKQKMTALDVMIAVGGLNEFAAGNRAKLIRQDRESATQVEYRLRLSDLVRKGDASANVMLMPGDTIIIPESRF
jgi:polysaccharide export outer membrane protein